MSITSIYEYARMPVHSVPLGYEIYPELVSLNNSKNAKRLLLRKEIGKIENANLLPIQIKNLVDIMSPIVDEISQINDHMMEICETIEQTRKTAKQERSYISLLKYIASFF